MATTENGQKKVTSASAWKGKKGTDLELPSGNVCRVRNPGMDYFIRAGIIPDSLTGMVRQMISGKGDVELTDLVKTDDDLQKLFGVVDDILIEVVLEPVVNPVPMRTVENDEGKEVREPVPFAERDEDKLYVDEVDFDDKIFVFQFACGGTRDLEKFREQQEQAMESVRSGEAVEVST